MSAGLPGEWREPDAELLDALTRDATLAADHVAISMLYTSATDADRIRATVRAALRFALANRLVVATPLADWPEWRVLDPPEDRP